MKKIVLAVICIIALNACKNQEEKKVEKAKMQRF
jgi:uncharacterized lipoprotein YehR (DUF1307 family)